MDKKFVVAKVNKTKDKEDRDLDGYSIFWGCGSSSQHFATYEEAEKAMKGKAARNLETKYGLYELKATVEAPLPELEVKKVEATQ